MGIIIEILRRLNLIPVPLVDTHMQLIRARAVLEANRHGVFAALAERPDGLTAEEASQRVGLSALGTLILLNALVSAGYVRQRDGRYRNGPWVNRWILDPKRGLSNYLKLQTNVWTRLDWLPQTLKEGKPPTDMHEEFVATPSEAQEVYTFAMRELAGLLLPAFLKRVSLPAGATRLLDIGGAHGEYSRSLMRKYPGLHATVLDLAGPIVTAQRIQEKEGNPQGLELRIGNAFTDDLGTGWDAVLLANVVHVFDAEHNATLFRRIREALGPKGTLLILDQFTGLGRLADRSVGLFSLNLFNVGGLCHPISDLQRLLAEASFPNVTVHRFSPWRATSLVQARNYV